MVANCKIIYLIQILITFILCLVILCRSENCHDDPVPLDEHFFRCCNGSPKYTSKSCIDALLENNTFSQECLVDCMYTQFEIYDRENIDLAAVKTFLHDQVADEDFNIMYMHAFERCSQLDKNSIKNKFSFIKIHNEHDCDEYPTFMEICVWYHTIANCPEKYVTHDESCNNKREWIKECLIESLH